ncbi:MAG: hypothetical protein ACXACU_12740 [Candidatus Hodarchaeales archaeon]|jgi:hypothetical protein
MSEQSNSHFYVGSLITSGIGGILIILFDFAWWYNYNAGVRSWGWIDLSLDNLLSAPILLFVAACLFFCTYISFVRLQSPDNEVNSPLLQSVFLAAIVACVVVLVGAIVFIVVMLLDEPSEWGFDVGFYGGLIGSALTIVLLYLAKSNQ